MANNKQHLKPISRAQQRRSRLPWYFDLNGKWLFVLVAVGAALLGLLALAQTGRVATAAYQLRQLQDKEKALLWEQEDLLKQIARAADPAALEEWARKQDMVPLRPQDITAVPLVRGDLSGIADSKPIAEQP